MRAMHEKDSASRAASTSEKRVDWAALVNRLKYLGQGLGLSALGIARPELSAAGSRLHAWLAQSRHGEMDYMSKHASLRSRPDLLLPGTLSVISAHLPYWPQDTECQQALTDAQIGYVSRYARGRDYHKTLRRRLQKLAEALHAELTARGLGEDFRYRVFSDSAPVMECELACQAGIGWRGKNTLSLTRHGSWHFLGEIYTNLPLPPDTTASAHCGDCRRCLDACPTGALIAPYELDARRCISYLTIELRGAIPAELRPLLGNRIYGCDDCQSCCPWNRFARKGDPDFAVRHGLDATPLSTLFAWSAEAFDARLAGSPIRRLGHERWLRNIAVALGNAPPSAATRASLEARRDDPSPLVREHVAWALQRQAEKEHASEPDFPAGKSRPGT